MMQRRGFLKTIVGLVARGAAAPAVAKPTVGDAAVAYKQYVALTACRLLAQQFPEEVKIAVDMTKVNAITLQEYGRLFRADYMRHLDDHGL